jgi:hypothetical protein
VSAKQCKFTLIRSLVEVLAQHGGGEIVHADAFGHDAGRN